MVEDSDASCIRAATTRRHMTGDGAATYTYNDAGRMVSATQAGVTTSYAINALGQRVRKTTSGVSTYFVYDQAGHLVGEYDNAGALIQETVWFEDIPVATLKPNGGSGVNVFYIHTDHLNTPRRISRPSDSAVVWRWDSDPFGSSAANEDPDGDTQLFNYGLRFPGSYADSETGLLYNWHRSLDPQSGRYTTSDPIGLRGGLNTYAYANGNPISNFDPDGLVVRGRGCTDKGWARIQDAERRIRKELEKGCECTPDSQGSCIPCDIRPQLLRALDTSVVNCSFSTRVCGEAPRGGSYATIMRPGFDDPVGCGCVALTLYHELLHNAGLTEPQVGPLDRGCTTSLCNMVSR